MNETIRQPILFLDFNGVLSYNKFWTELEGEGHQYNSYWPLLQEYLFTTNRKLLDQWMLGNFTSEDVHKIIESDLGIPYDFLFPLFVKSCKEMDISEPILNQIEKLKSTYYCILATGNMDSLERFTLPENPRIEVVFDRIDNSYNIKMHKHTNNGEYFAKCAAERNVALADCVLIDDSKKTCDVFEALGGKAFNVTGEDRVLEALESLYLALCDNVILID